MFVVLFSDLKNKTNAHSGNSFLLTPRKIKKALELGLMRKNVPALFVFAPYKCVLVKMQGV